MNKAELLAPAGDLERLDAAIYFGADAVYIGGPMLQLRADIAGFDENELAEAVRRAHGKGKKLYVAVNSLVRNGELEGLGDYAKRLYELGADAVIVTDLGALSVIKKAAPELEIHISTQASILNYEAARLYHSMGAKRIVLGRETTLDELAEIRAKTPKELELECFIHGAMCMAYSGRCMLSAYMNGRSANRGDCSQPCRYRYALHLTDGEDGEYYPFIEGDEGSMILSSRDLNTMPFIEKIIEAGASSLKIEGRMKSTYYVATVVNAYRRRLDGADAELCMRELECASHRDFTSGFYFGECKNAQSAGAEYKQSRVFAAMALGEENGRYIIEQRNVLCVGDTLEILSPYSMGESFTLTGMLDGEGNTVERAPHPKQRLSIECPFKLRAGDILRKL